MIQDAVFGIRYEDGYAWIDVCDANGVHSVALDPSAAIVTGRSLLDFGRRQITPAGHSCTGVGCMFPQEHVND